MVDNNEIQKRLQEARAAMGGINKINKNKLFDKKRRLEAVQAMEGQKHKEKKIEELELINKKREEARKAMENEAQRKQREERERKLAEEKALQRKIEATKMARLKKQEEKEREEELNKANQIKNTEKEKDQYNKRVLEAKNIINQIKSIEQESPKTYRTLKTDIQDQTIDNNLSLASMALQEEQRKRSQKEKASNNKTNLIKIIAIVVITTIGIGGLITTFFLISSKENTSQSFDTKNLIFVENKKEINTQNKDKIEIIDSINQEIISNNNENNQLTQIYLTNSIISDNKIVKFTLDRTDTLSLLDISLSSAFTHFLDQSINVILYKNENNNTISFILKTRSFENTLDFLLRNENQIIYAFLKDFTPEQEKGSIANNQFRDLLISNIDTRVLTIGEKTIAVYAFLDPNTLIITQNTEALNKIIQNYRK